ncbi:MAG TPA: pitrilysin family protein [Kofleriaceae bacterium]|nr:pitrilysin family protein [Kofleriaceae bacterium]
MLSFRWSASALAVTLTAYALAPIAASAETAGKPAAASAASATKVDIPFDEFTLPNGLRVIVHTDRKAPIVAVSVWYHVGSKNEPPGRSGFAHLFEHLMFQGSENHKGEYFAPFEQAGATNQNGTTNTDRTNYFENVPTTALDMALWMESDRMGHLVGAIDQGLLDEQRGVVQNEKRQGENQPYGQVFEHLAAASYPPTHPYHHTTIGSMNDLNAAKLDDVKNWFRSWYGPNNAVLVLAGDIDLATAKEKVTRYFGDIAPTANVPKMKPDIAPRKTSTHEVLTDAVPQPRIYRVWNVPQFGAAETDQLRLFAHVLGGARASRLDRRLVHQDKLCDSVSSSVQTSELGSVFFVQCDVKQGVDPATVEKELDEEVQKLIASGPTADELNGARTVFKAGFIRGIERIGGFGGKADTLAQCAVFTGKADCFRASLANVEKATPASVKAAGKKWLSKGDHTLTVMPGERKPEVEPPAVDVPPSKVPPPAKGLKAIKTDVDRSKGVPATTSFPPLTFPKLERATLSNGLKVVLASRPGLPVVQMELEVQGAGFASDPAKAQGTAAFTMGMLDEGAGDYDALAFGDREEALGAVISAGASLDEASLYLSALKENLDPSLALFSDVLLRPRLDDKDVERVRAQWLAGIKQEKARPQTLARRVVRPILYGAGHPYAAPASGTGDEAAIAALKRDDLQKFIKTKLTPGSATLLIVGDTTLAEIQPKLESALAGWKAAPAPAGGAAAGAGAAGAAVPTVTLPTRPRVFLLDQPGAIQANILVSELVPSTKDPGSVELEVANSVLGGEFSSRLNMNLREDKHWAYGAYSGLADALGQRPWAASAAVQIDKTVDSIKEMKKEIDGYVTGKAPATPDELTKVQNNEIRGLPGSYETAAAVLGTIDDIVLYGRPDDWPVQRAARMQALTPAQVNAAATTIKPTAETWIIVGDLSKIEAGVRALNLGDVKVLDADGKVIR